MKWFLVASVFMVVLASHYFYVTRPLAGPTAGQWASYEFEQPDESRLNRYVGPGEYWLGLSYGLAGAFATLCMLSALARQKRSLAASTGGFALSGLLAAGICFLTGCCGSPMIPIYLGLLGPKFLGTTKPLTFVVTLISIIISYAWISRRSHKVWG